MLDYRLVEAFAVVLEEKGFEKAARRLCITQSAVSQRIKQLEELHGQILLQRTNPPRPTEAGVSLLNHFVQVRHLEEDLLARSAQGTRDGFITLAIGINADSLAVWFLTAIRPFLADRRVALELQVDDQDRTDRLLQQGKVLGCITTRSSPLQGCRVSSVGVMEYILCSSPAFQRSWFPHGLTAAAAERAPAIRFNRKDGLNDLIFRQIFKIIPAAGPTFFIPSTESFGDFVKSGLCYGVLPRQQAETLLEKGELVDLAPGYRVSVELFWHCWNLRSEILESFTAQLLAGAKDVLATSAGRPASRLQF